MLLSVSSCGSSFISLRVDCAGECIQYLLSVVYSRFIWSLSRMRLILQSLRKNGVGFARFYGLNYAPAMLRQFPHNLSSREELSTLSKFSRSQSSHLEKKPYVSSGSAPPPASPGSGNQLKLLLGGSAVLAVIAVLVSLPSIRSKREQASILYETEQSDAKGSEVIGNGDRVFK